MILLKLLLQSATFLAYHAGTSLKNGSNEDFIKSCSPLLAFFIIYLFIGAILFISMGRMVNILLGELRSEITSTHNDATKMVTNRLLDVWRDKYQIICELVGALNRCFGLLIVILLAFQFIWMVNSSYSCVIGFRDFNTNNYGPTLLNLGFEMVAFICFTYISYIPHTIKQQVGLFTI